MKKLLALLLCTVILLPSCNRPKEPLEIIKERLSEDCSVRIASQYMSIGINRYTKKIIAK